MQRIPAKLKHLHDIGLWSAGRCFMQIMSGEAIVVLLTGRLGVGALAVVVAMMLQVLSLKWTMHSCTLERCPLAMRSSGNGPRLVLVTSSAPAETEEPLHGKDTGHTEADPGGVRATGE